VTSHDWWLVLALLTSGLLGALVALDVWDLLNDRGKPR
jgi:hypothetical protein